MNRPAARIYFAPLEGVTDPVFRRLHAAHFGHVCKYYIPFISPTQHLTLTSREQRAVSPGENEGLHAVPQILAKAPLPFLETARMLFQLGYEEVNLNLGCPSGTVTAKGKGAGLLRDLPALQAFLDEVYEKAPGPVSIKTRIGYESDEEWPSLWTLLRQYPISELTIHARCRLAQYKGRVHEEAWACARDAPFPIVLNGDLATSEALDRAHALYPDCALMVGRGLVTNPALAREYAGGSPLDRSELQVFHDALLEAYCQRWPVKVVLGHMQEIMSYFLCGFEETGKIRKQIHKARTIEEYTLITRTLFGSCPMKEPPAFSLEAFGK